MHYPNIAIEFFIQLIKSRLSKTLLVQTKNFKMPKLQQKQQKISNNGASNNGTKRGHPAKVTPTSRDKSKKVSSLPVIICIRMFYTEITYVYLRVTRTQIYVLYVVCMYMQLCFIKRLSSGYKYQYCCDTFAYVQVFVIDFCLCIITCYAHVSMNCNTFCIFTRLQFLYNYITIVVYAFAYVQFFVLDVLFLYYYLLCTCVNEL